MQKLAPGQFELVDESTMQAAAGTVPAAPAPNALKAGQFELLPQYADGTSPMSPLNKSPVSVEDRLAFALGNKVGTLKALKSKFEDAIENEDGDLVVKQGGMWHRVDGKTLGDSDAWSATKSILKGVGAGIQAVANKTSVRNPVYKGEDLGILGATKDDALAKETASEIAENAPTVAAIGAGAAAGLATGGLGLTGFAAAGVNALADGAAAAAIQTARTSLGRLEGTYEATPEEQLKDVAYESLFNMAGTGFIGGVKPTAGRIAEKLPTLAEKFSKLQGAPLDLIKKVYASNSIGEEHFDTMMEASKEVKAVMKHAAGVAGDGVGFVDKLKSMSVKKIAEMVDTAQPILSDIYNGMSRTMKNRVGHTFAAELDEVTSSVFKNAIDDGFVAIKTPVRDAAGVAIAGGGKRMTAAEAAELIANNGGRIPKEYGIEVLGKQDIRQAILKSGNLNNAAIAFDDEAHAALKQFVGTVQSLHRTNSLRGQEGFEQLLKLNKVLDDMTFKVRTMADNEGMTALANKMASYHTAIRKTVESKLDAQGVGTAFRQMQSTYSAMKDEVGELLSASRRAARSDNPNAVYESVMRKLTARPGANAQAKEGLAALINAAEQYGSPHAQTLRAAQRAVRVNEAAIAWNPIVRKDLVGRGSATMAIGSLVTGNPQFAAPLAVMAGVTSPRAAGHVAVLSNSMWQGKEWLARQNGKVLNALIENPEALNAFVSTIVQTPMMQEQVTGTLLQQNGIPVK